MLYRDEFLATNSIFFSQRPEEKKSLGYEIDGRVKFFYFGLSILLDAVGYVSL